VRRDDVVAWLMERFGLEPSAREKVARRYHELETGQLDARRANPTLIQGLADLLRARVADVLAWKPRSLAAEPAYFRATPGAAQPALLARAAEPPDEVDRLFGVGA
jgi:hypothetical protein